MRNLKISKPVNIVDSAVLLLDGGPVTIWPHSEVTSTVETYSMFLLISVVHEQHFHSLFAQNGQNR